MSEHKPIDIDNRFSNKWFQQWTQTDSYLASDGYVARIPLRLMSTNLVLYGTADYDEALKEFEHEDFVPVTVGGKVPVQIWFNNFLDTDCGPSDCINAYTETWFSFPVTVKANPLDLPFESPFSYLVEHPDTLNWTHRVICGPDKTGYRTGAVAAIAGGREVWGFPKHPAVADLRFDYQDEDRVEFSASLLNKKVISVSAKLPEKSADPITMEVDAQTPADHCLTPKQNPLQAGFIPKQTRYGTAMAATMNFVPWDNSVDSLEIYAEEEHYSALLKAWNFTPVLKMHTSDFKVVAFKPAGWGAELIPSK